MIKNILLTVAFILGVGVFYLFTQSQNVHEVRSEIMINAPKDKVWAAITDIEGWADKSSAINASSLTSVGALAEGSELSITMRSDVVGEDGPTYAPIIIKFEDQVSYRWRAVMGVGIIFTNDKQFELTEVDGGVRLVHSEYFNGMMLPLMKGFLDQGVSSILDEMNQGFKTEAEQ